MKWQLSKKEKRKAGWAADENAAPGGRGGTWQGVGVGRKDRATQDSEHRAAPVGGWQPENTTHPLGRHQTGLGFLFCFQLGHGCLLVTGGTRAKSYSLPLGFPSFHSAMAISHFGNLALNKWSGTGGKLMFSVTSWGWLTCRRPTRGRVGVKAQPQAQPCAPLGTGAASCCCWGMLVPAPITAQLSWDLQELICKPDLPMDHSPAPCPEATLGLPRAACQAVRIQSGHSHARDLLPTPQLVSSALSRKAKCLLLIITSRDTFLITLPTKSHVAYGKKFQTDLLPRCHSLAVLGSPALLQQLAGEKVLQAGGNAHSPAEEPEAAQQLVPAPCAGRLAGNRVCSPADVCQN